MTPLPHVADTRGDLAFRFGRRSPHTHRFHAASSGSTLSLAGRFLHQNANQVNTVDRASDGGAEAWGPVIRVVRPMGLEDGRNRDEVAGIRR